MPKKLLTSLLFVLILTASVSAAPLSHALDIIRSKVSHTVSVHETKAYSFSREDFYTAVGAPFDKVVVKSLPETGILKFGVDEIGVGAVIPKSELSALRYLPEEDFRSPVSFTFNTHTSHAKSDYTLTLSPAESETPVANSGYYETYRSVAVVKDLSEINGEGYTYHAVTGAEHGTLAMSEGGRFTYTPYSNFTGRDEFEYCIKDENGNVSKSEKVEIRVRRPWKNLCFTDMVGREGHAEAIKLCETGCADVILNTEGKPIFMPDAPLSRAEFVSWAMSLSGIEYDKAPLDTVNVFLDADTISPKYESAVCAAVGLGYIRGRDVSGQSLIEADAQIRLDEAITVISRILETSTPVKADTKALTRGEGASLIFKLLTDK